jgi:hypothetical protein
MHHIDVVLQRIPEERRGLARAFIRRSVALIERIAAEAPAGMLKESLTSATDVGSLARILTCFAAEDAVRSADPLAEAFARGAELQQELVGRAGGLWPAARVAGHLGVTRQAVDKRRKRGTLLAVESASGFLYPGCQFVEAGVLRGLAAVLQAMDTSSGWTQLSLLCSELDGSPGRTLLDALRAGDAESAVRAARSWGSRTPSG